MRGDMRRGRRCRAPRALAAHRAHRAQVFEDRGVHARAAVGVVSLPLGVPVEIDLIAQVDD